MLRRTRLSLALASLALAAPGVYASTAYGDLNNFDTINDTGHECHGFEIEIDDVRGTDVTYTYDWNHYGAPKIREDLADPLHPRVFIRYESAKNPDGTWAAYTAIPAGPMTPTDGHTCTDPTVNQGCEHFGVGYYGTPTAVQYHWLLDDGAGNLVHGPAVLVATPSWSYAPPAPAQPAQVIAVIPAPVVPIPAAGQFGEPSWVKVVKTTTHNANNIILQDLISDDLDGDGEAEWQNNEPDEVETEFYLLQARDGGGGPKDEIAGAADDMGDGSETVTRRYEFYKYGAAADTRDGENGEAMCSEVNPTTDPNDPNYLHGVGDHVAVTDSNGDTYYVDCAAQVVVGDYVGAQMAGFDAAMPLGMVESLQDGERNVAFMPRTVVIGGNSPYAIQLTQGALPPGLALGDYVDPDSGATAHGVLSGTPTSAGQFGFTVQATDADNVTVSRSYTMAIVGDIVIPQHALAVTKAGSGSGTVAGNGIDCGATCTVQLDEGTNATLTATPAAGSVFNGWSGACGGTGNCAVTINADTDVTATFTQRYELAVSKSGGGAGTVSGSGIDCGATCTTMLDAGTAVTLSATPAAGSVFTGWSGACTGTGSCTTTMDGNRAVTASFVPATQKFLLTVVNTGSGTVTSSPKGINCRNDCSNTYNVGTTVVLSAKPAKKHVFLGWSGGVCSGTALTCSVPMNSDQTVTATFQ